VCPGHCTTKSALKTFTATQTPTPVIPTSYSDWPNSTFWSRM